MRVTLALALPVLFMGCAHESDIQIQNPLGASTVGNSQIVKPHDYIENQRGLPRGSVADMAELISADPQQICFGLTMHELDPIDLHEMEVALKTDKAGPNEQARLEPAPVTFASYDGLVPETTVTGEETYCASRNGEGVCLAWRTRPVKSTQMVQGQVKVYEAKGRVCFDNGQLLTANTHQLTLQIKVRRRLGQGAGVVAPFGMWGGGGGSKQTIFRWGLGGSKG